jgi:hypothetical protein
MRNGRGVNVMKRFRVKHLLIGALLVVAAFLISRLHGPAAPVRFALTWLLCGMGGVGILKGLGIMSHQD